MARKRSIDPRFFKHGDLYDAEARAGLPLMLAFAGLWGQADRRGIFEWKPRELKLEVLPWHPVDFAAVLTALESSGFVKSYVVSGRRYGIIPSFARWQTFHHNEKPSDAPNPPEDGPAPTPEPPKTAPPTQQPDIGEHEPSNGEAEPSNGERSPTVIGYRLSTTDIGHRLSVDGSSDDTTEPPGQSIVHNRDGTIPNREAVVSPMLYAQQEHEVRAACEPHVALAITALMSRHSQPYTVIYEIWACATGVRYLRGKQTGKRVETEHVIAAIWEMTVNDARWNVSLFRGYCMRCADQPPVAKSPQERSVQKVLAEAKKFALPESVVGDRDVDGTIVSRPIELPVDDSPERQEQRAIARREAMAKLRAEFKRNQAEAA